MDVVSLGPRDQPRLEIFSCVVGAPRSWELSIQDLVHRLAGELADARNAAEAIGLEENGELCAVAAWVPVQDESEAWGMPLLAVRSGYKRHGLGERIKRQVLERARAAGVLVVVSTVHVENEAMLALNRKLGASISIDPENWDYMICSIRL